MSVLVNLLPDIRVQKQKDQERRRLATLATGIVVAVCVVFISLMLVITMGQSTLIKKAVAQIADKKSQLTKMKDLVPALTAQAKLDSLDDLFPKRVLMSKLVIALSEVSPTTTQLTSVKYDSLDESIEVQGVSKSYSEAAKLAHALEAAHKTIGTGSPTEEPYFTNVYLKSAELASMQTKGVSFTLTAKVEPGAIHAEQAK
jgi:Tfp pilus assembly protein PilN